jgi:hypothetical protein
MFFYNHSVLPSFEELYIKWSAEAIPALIKLRHYRYLRKIVGGVYFQYAFGCDPNRQRLEAGNIAKEANHAWSLLMWGHQIRD